MVEHSARAHALLSASGAHKWMHCTPSARLEDTFANETSDFAEEGTTAHEYAELLIQQYWGAERPETVNEGIARIKSSKWYTLDFEMYVREYADYIINLMLYAKRIDPHAVCMTEKLLDFSYYVPEGTGTGDYIEYCNHKITVVDLKFGKGVSVSAVRNPQLMLYALGLWLEVIQHGISVDRVKMVVYQPRIENISEWEIPISELITWAEQELAPKALMAWKGEGTFNAGDHCKFCRAKSVCGAMLNEFKNLDEVAKGNTSMTEEEVIQYVLERGGLVKAYIDHIHSTALNNGLNGKPPQGYKVVRGRGTRSFTDKNAIERILVDTGWDAEHIYEERTLRPLTHIEKLVGKKLFTEVFAEHIEIKSGKPSLVPESDDRPAISNVSDFIDYTDTSDNGGNEY